jgi:NAD(P)-dependent dehydrogenase (short-subunit alcohol dehydrogenase family)
MNGCWPSFQPISNVADMEIEGSVVVVTGAGSGIGCALAQSFAAAGARVVVSDIDAVSADGTAASIAAVGHTAVARPADACIAADIRGLTAVAVAEFGRNTRP